MTVDEALAVATRHHQEGRSAEAGELCRRILEVAPDNADALHLLGLNTLNAGAFMDGLALIDRALTANPCFAEAWFNRGSVLRAMGQTAKAAASWRRALAVNPGLGAPWYNLGTIHYAEGGAGMPKAVRALSRATRLDPRRAEAHHDLALALRQVGQIDDAVASQRRAIAAKTEYLSAYMNLGNALLDRGDPQEAATALQTALTIAPASPECWYNLANVHYADNNLPGALSCYHRAARLGLRMAWVRVATILIALDRLDEAESVLTAILPVEGTDVSTAIELLAEIIIRPDRMAEARARFVQLAQTPLSGRLYAGECQAALATIDLLEDQPHAAAARLAPITGDNCWVFTVRSLAAFHATQADRGGRIERPPAIDHSRPRVTSSTLANRGRFAHNVLEYILLRLYAEKYGYTLETPDWVGGTFFALDDPPQSGPLAPLLFGRQIINDLVTGTSARAPIADCDVLSPLFLFEHKEEYRERVQSWLKPRPEWMPFLEPAVERLRAAGATVVAVHIRRGDFVQYKYPITETAWYVAWLRELWPTLERPVLYLASDDLTATCRDFAEFHPLTRADVIAEWPGLDYLQDFYVLTQADMVGISAASGFSVLAARLNTRATLFVEPDMEAQCIRPFQPWIPS